MDDANGNGNDADDADLRRRGVEVVTIAPDGDVVLEVLFEQSKETLRAAKRTSAIRNKTALHQAPDLKRQERVACRVSSKTLIQQSSYFARLLDDVRFDEAQALREVHAKLKARGVEPGDAEPQDLPWISIEDDDEATHLTGREAVFIDILRILHKLKLETRYTNMRQLAIMAALADRFDCAAGVSGPLRPHVQLKTPASSIKSAPLSEDSQPLSLSAEELLRQQIYVFWTLSITVQPRLTTATRALIMHGSRKWAASPTADQEKGEVSEAIWWSLPANLERELHFRRECILNTIASIPSHFLHLYSSRERQCKLGYDSSKACDSYQLGEMVRFLLHKRLLHLTDFGPRSLDDALDAQSMGMEIGGVISALRQCPAYQVDKNHTNCGLRTRMLPILEYVQAMLSANVVAVAKGAWEKNRAAISWYTDRERRDASREKPRVFRFSRSLATDPRLRYEGALAVDRFAREMFTADEWDWTPED
jgi:hypothetical protein